MFGIKLKLLSITLSQQYGYLRTNKLQNDNELKRILNINNRILNRIAINDKLQNELYIKCQSIKLKILKDIIQCVEHNKIELNIKLYDDIIKCCKLNLLQQFKASHQYSNINREGKSKY